MGYWESLLDGMEPITYVEKSDQHRKRFSFQVTRIDDVQAVARPRAKIGSRIKSIMRKEV
ncbi:MAG: hypothetical protein ABR986_11810 [Methanomassiliicoccales archaeon]|jgi:hypothetical protein